MYVYSKYRNPTWLLPLFISYLTTGNCEHPSTKERQLGAVEIQFYYYVKKSWHALCNFGVSPGLPPKGRFGVRKNE